MMNVEKGLDLRGLGRERGWSAVRKLPRVRYSYKTTRGNESIDCGTVGTVIVYSVRIGPPQPIDEFSEGSQEERGTQRGTQ